MRQKIVEFDCSQEELFDAVMNLAKMGKWPVGWHFHDLGTKNTLGFIELQVGRERRLRRRGVLPPSTALVDVQFFRRVGVIHFAKVTKARSALILRSTKPPLQRFFDDLVAILTEYFPPGSLSRPPRPLQPLRGSKLEDWFDYYHGMNEAGYKMTFMMLAKISGFAYNTFKNRHAQYMRARGVVTPK